MGCLNPDSFRIEEALDSLRGREDFRLLMMDLAMPAEPFTQMP
jgi:CheY-like chemotaxis protein